MHRPILAGAIRAAALLAAMLTGIGLATATQAAQPDKARVIVTFKAGAGPGAKAAINAAGGRVAGVPREIARSIGFDADQFGQLQHLLSVLIENLDAAGPTG